MDRASLQALVWLVRRRHPAKGRPRRHCVAGARMPPWAPYAKGGGQIGAMSLLHEWGAPWPHGRRRGPIFRWKASGGPVAPKGYRAGRGHGAGNTGGETFDYVIVGAGTAGCLLANRLSADPGTRVLLLEAGPKDSYHWIHIPVGYLYCIGNPRTDWMYSTEAAPGLNGRSLLYPRGKTLGGCSSINGMIYMRGQARDYDGWAQITGEDAWGWQASLEDFKRHEDHYRLDGGADPVSGDNGRFSDLHGSGGEWRVEKQRLRWDVLDSFAEAAAEAGIEPTQDFNTGDNAGVGYFDVNQRAGWRWNASKAFLRPARHRANLTIWTGAQAERLTFDRKGALRCDGVVVRRGAASVTARARREVVLAAGAVNSPALLQLSGLGPAELLRAHGIEVLWDVPGVGRTCRTICRSAPSTRWPGRRR